MSGARTLQTLSPRRVHARHRRGDRRADDVVRRAARWPPPAPVPPDFRLVARDARRTPPRVQRSPLAPPPRSPRRSRPPRLSPLSAPPPLPPSDPRHLAMRRSPTPASPPCPRLRLPHRLRARRLRRGDRPWAEGARQRLRRAAQSQPVGVRGGVQLRRGAHRAHLPPPRVFGPSAVHESERHRGRGGRVMLPLAHGHLPRAGGAHHRRKRRAPRRRLHRSRACSTSGGARSATSRWKRWRRTAPGCTRSTWRIARR